MAKPSNTDVALEWLAFRLPFSARKKYDSFIENEVQERLEAKG